MAFTNYGIGGAQLLAQGLAGLGDGITAARKQQSLADLGQSIQGGDYAAGAQKAFAAGDLQTGLSLLKLGQDAALQKQGAAAFNGLPSIDGTGGGGSAPAPLASPSPARTSSAAPTPPDDVKQIIAQNVPQELQPYAYNLAAKESSFDPGAVSKTGATGLFQFTRGTGKDYGLVSDAGDLRKDPVANTKAFVALTTANREALTQALGRPPSDGELALAHQQGAQGAISLLQGGSVPANNLAVNGIAPGDPQAAQKIMSFYGGQGGASVAPAAAPRQVAQGGSQTATDASDDDTPTGGIKAAGGPPAKAADPARDSLIRAQSAYTRALATPGLSDGQKASINQTLGQIKTRIDKIDKDAEPDYQFMKDEDGGIVAISKSDPTNVTTVTKGRPKSQRDYDERKTIADDQGLTGDERKQFLLNGKVPDGSHVLKPGDVLAGPQGATLAENNRTGGGTSLDDNALDFAARRALSGDNGGIQGQSKENRAAIAQRMADIAKQEAISPTEPRNQAGEAQGYAAGQRTFGQATARAEVFGQTAYNALDLAREASANVSRTRFVPFNQAAEAVRTGTSDPAMAKFVTANNTLVAEYAKATSPGGVPTDSQREHAREMLSTAKGPEAYNAVLDQMKKEIEFAQKSPAEAQRRIQGIRRGASEGAQSDSNAGATGLPPIGVGQTYTHPSGITVKRIK